MTSATRTVWLVRGLLPYLGLVSMDAWMHERTRQVPKVERLIHYVSALVLIAFVSGVFTGRRTLAVICLAIFVPLLAWDALGFHRTLAQSERRVHLAAYLAFTVFVAVWQWTETST